MKTSIGLFLKAFILVSVGLLFTRATEQIIPAIAPVRAINEDLFFKILPHIDWMAYVADLAVLLGFIVTLPLLYKQGKAPYYFALLGIMYAIRAILNVLTPLGDPSGDAEVYGFLELAPAYGMFPSGHTGFLVLSGLLLRESGQKRAMYAVLFLLFIEILALLSSRGHYSIDIVGGAMLSYILYIQGKKYYDSHFKANTSVTKK